VMLRTHAQLIEMHGRLDHGHVDQMMGHFLGTAEWLKASAHG
jgi:hypothetical protein